MKLETVQRQRQRQRQRQYPLMLLPSVIIITYLQSSQRSRATEQKRGSNFRSLKLHTWMGAGFLIRPLTALILIPVTIQHTCWYHRNNNIFINLFTVLLIALQISTRYLFHAGFPLVLFLDPEEGGEMFLRNVGWLSMHYTTLYHRRRDPS
jgi:hypothetical protein